MQKSIRNALLAGAVVVAVVGVAGAAKQPKPVAHPSTTMPNAPSHRHGQSRFFVEYDLNKDGKITKDEFNKVVAEHFQQAGGGKPINAQQFAAYRTKSRRQHGDQMFRRADWNGDGKLSLDEFANPIRASFERADKQSAGFVTCHPHQDTAAQPTAGSHHGRRGAGSRGAGSFCAHDDLNHDGKVTHAELDKALAAQFAAASKGGALNRDQFLAMEDSRSRVTSGRGFERLDRDHNGTLSLQEFAEPEQRLFARLDKNGDGVITRDEMASSRRNFGQKRPAAHG